MSALEDNLKSFIEAIVEERLASLPRIVPTAIDEDVQKQIAQHQLIANKTYLNKKEIALYLGCSERSVEDWSARAPKDNPLPVGYVGSDMRAKRESLDRWVEGEAQRKRLKLAS
jgi:hypothetical protein